MLKNIIINYYKTNIGVFALYLVRFALWYNKKASLKDNIDVLYYSAYDSAHILYYWS